MAERAGWPEEITIKLQSFAQGGYAMGHWEGRPVFASGGLPDEYVRVRLVERAGAHARGEVIEVLSASPQRLAPPGASDPRCAGCDWHFIDYQTQLAGKAEILRDQLRHMGRIPDPLIQPPVPSQPWGYRTTARLHVEGSSLGFYAPGTRQVQPIDSSPLLHPLLNEAIAALLPLLPIPGLRAVTLRASLAEQTSLALLHGGERAVLAERAARWRAGLPALRGVALATADGWQLLSGTAYLFAELGGIRLRLSPASFFQANLPMTQELLAALRQALDLQSGDHLLDAYCGVGTFTLPLAHAAPLASAVGIEEGRSAIGDARASAVQAGLRNVSFIIGRVEEVLARHTWEQPPTAALLDPPRRGVAPAALQRLIALCPQRIAYISCHPGTLARDLRMLTEGGYRLRFAQPFDFFPQTSHVESLAVLDWHGRDAG